MLRFLNTFSSYGHSNKISNKVGCNGEYFAHSRYENGSQTRSIVLIVLFAVFIK